MSEVFKHVVGNWTVVAATITALGLMVAVVKYKIPELTKKVLAMETDNKARPTGKDLSANLASFKSHCQLNQVLCQKSVNIELAKVRKDIDDKLDSLTTLVNKQAIIIARVDERIGALYRNHDHSFIPPETMLNVK